MQQEPAGQGQSAAPPTPQRVMQMAFAFGPTLILAAAVHHRMFDLLDQGPLTVEELAQKTGASKRGIRAIADALVGLGFLARADQRYTLVPESELFLVRGKPGYHGGALQHMVTMIPHWLRLNDIVATGKPATMVDQPSDGSRFFHDFVEDLFAMNYPGASALARSLNLSRLDKPYRVLDLASGSGVWGIAVAQQSPRVQVTAVDWEGVLETTRRVVGRHHLQAQFEYVAGDLDAANFGSGYQLATLGHILHSEGPDASAALIKKVHAALAPGGTIAIAEFIRPDPIQGSPMPLIFAVNMLVCTETGDTFTMAQISQWLTAAGFRDVRTLEIPAPSPLILATKP